jgi:hypothetical protein
MRPALLLVLALALAAAPAAPARIGETLSQLKQRYGRPGDQPRKDVALWLFEATDGQLLFTATFNDRGVCIAEGLKPLKRAQFTDEDAKSFIDLQLGVDRDPKTTRVVPPGTKYVFGGKEFVCGQNEIVLLDEAHGILVVWTQSASPAVMAVSREMVQ